MRLAVSTTMKRTMQGGTQWLGVVLVAVGLVVGCTGDRSGSGEDGEAVGSIFEDRFAEETVVEEEGRFRLWGRVGYSIPLLDPAIQKEINPQFEPGYRGITLAGGWGLEQVVGDDEDILVEAPRSQYQLESVELKTEHVTVERLFTYRHSNYADPSKKPPLGGSNGINASPERQGLVDVVDFEPGVVRTGEHFLGGVFSLDEGHDVGRVTGLCIESAERAKGEGPWVERSGCQEMYWSLCSGPPEAPECAELFRRTKEQFGWPFEDE